MSVGINGIENLGGNAIFGDGSNGDVIISGATSLTSDMFYNNLTINSGQTLTVEGYRIYVKNTLTNNGTIRDTATSKQGGNASGVNGGGAPSSARNNMWRIIGGSNGANGGVGGTGAGQNGVAGTNPSTDYEGFIVAVNGTQGGDGGSSGATAGGTHGALGTASAVTTKNIPKALPHIGCWVMTWNSSPLFIRAETTTGGSSGGGAGAGDGTNNGGNGGGSGSSGAGGGVVFIAAMNIVNTGTITATGGNGGNSANATAGAGGNAGGGGGGAGGSGGNGGLIILIYNNKSGSGTTNISGGIKGTGGALGAGSGTGNPGTVGSDGNNGSNGYVVDLRNQ